MFNFSREDLSKEDLLFIDEKKQSLFVIDKKITDIISNISGKQNLYLAYTKKKKFFEYNLNFHKNKLFSKKPPKKVSVYVYSLFIDELEKNFVIWIEKIRNKFIKNFEETPEKYGKLRIVPYALVVILVLIIFLSLIIFNS